MNEMYWKMMTYYQYKHQREMYGARFWLIIEDKEFKLISLRCNDIPRNGKELTLEEFVYMEVKRGTIL